MKKVTSYLGAVPVLLALLCFLAFPARYVPRVAEGISLWAVAVLPATLPFLFLTAVLMQTRAYPKAAQLISPVYRNAFRISGAGGLAAVISALSGYPVGARTVCDLYERGAVDRQEVFRLAAITTTSGPMFLVGCVGAGMYKSASIGWILYASHLIGVYTMSFFLRFSAKKQPVRLPPVLPRRQDANALLQSVLSVLTVGGAIGIFYAFSAMANDVFALAGLKNYVLTALLTGLIEMTSGCQKAAGFPLPYSAALSCFFVTFGGGCVLLQQLVFLRKAGVKTLPFLAVKLTQGVVAALIALVLGLLVA